MSDIEPFKIWPKKPVMSDEQQRIYLQKGQVDEKLSEIQSGLENLELTTNIEKIINFSELSKKLRSELTDIHSILKKHPFSDVNSLQKAEKSFVELCKSFENPSNKSDFQDLIDGAYQYCETLMLFNSKIITPIDSYYRKRKTRLLLISISTFVLLGSLYWFIFHSPLTPFELRMNYISKFELAKTTTVRIVDLSQIAKALELYYQDNKAYPISKDSAWISVKTVDPKNGWIPGLVPKYMSYVPVDPQQSWETFRQYIYMSDGKNYKLLAHETSEVSSIKHQFPELVDPQREKYSFGFWSPGAKDW